MELNLLFHACLLEKSITIELLSSNGTRRHQELLVSSLKSGQTDHFLYLCSF